MSPDQEMGAPLDRQDDDEWKCDGCGAWLDRESNREHDCRLTGIVCGGVVADSSDRDAWLAARQQYVCGSDVAQMLGVGYSAKNADKSLQRNQLVMLKAGLAEPWSGNESSRIGQLMERYLFAPMAWELLGWKLEPFGLLVRDAECHALAATPDFLMRTPWGVGVVQTKDSSACAQEDCRPLRDGSPSTATYASGPPLYYQVQLIAELACTGLEWGALLVLHSANGGKKLRPYVVRRHVPLVARIRAEAERLMRDVEALRAGRLSS